MRTSILAILLTVLVGSAGAQDNAGQSLPTLVVAPLDGDVSAVLGWQPALGEGLAEMLVTEISRLNRFDVLESTGLKDLINEVQLGEEGFVGNQEKVDKGGFAGADFMFRGKVTRFGSNTKGTDLGGFVPGSLGRLGAKLTTADVRIDWRLIDVHTRRIVKADSAVGNHKGGGFDIGVAVKGSGGNIGFENTEFMNSALGKATVKAVTNITQKLATLRLPESGRRQSKAQAQNKQQVEVQVASDALKQTPGRVLAVAGKDTIVVSLGSKMGFKSGDMLNLFQTVDIKNEKGEVVFSDEKLAGTITLTNVKGESSQASYDGNLEVKEGWMVKAK